MFEALIQIFKIYIQIWVSIDWLLITILEDLVLKLCNLECITKAWRKCAQRAW